MFIWLRLDGRIVSQLIYTLWLGCHTISLKMVHEGACY